MRVVPAKNGWSWLVRGFALFRKSPPMWLFLVFTYWIAATLLGQIRYVGPAASTVLLPVFFVSFMVDRKSTRLNSSHSQISYAVFCLKKKNNCFMSRFMMLS